MIERSLAQRADRAEGGKAFFRIVVEVLEVLGDERIQQREFFRRECAALHEDFVQTLPSTRILDNSSGDMVPWSLDSPVLLTLWWDGAIRLASASMGGVAWRRTLPRRGHAEFV
jgi:hypothetical protein